MSIIEWSSKHSSIDRRKKINLHKFLPWSWPNWLFDLAVLLSSIIIFFRRIDVFPLRNWDEAWYAEIIKNMANGKSGYLIPFWNGRYHFDHEPLYFWLSTAFVKIFGLGEWQVRIISATSAVLATYLVFLIGRKLANLRVAITSVLIFLTTGGVVIRFAHGNLDALLVCLFLATFYFFLKGKEKPFFNLITGITFGLGMLVKSWGIGMFPIALILSFSFFGGNINIKRIASIIFIGMAVILPWYLWGILRFDGQFVEWYILNPSEGRLTTPFANFSFAYFPFAFFDLGFWLLVPFLAIAVQRKHLKELSRRLILSLSFIPIIYIISLNFLSDKSAWYLIPAYSILALVLGYFAEILFKTKSRILIFIFPVVFILQYWNVLRIENIYPDRSIVGAKLGIKARQIIPLEDEVILEDPDFTSFLYYSNQNHIFTLQEDRKPGEWWIIKNKELDSFLKNNPKSWIITRNRNKFSGYKLFDKLGDYYFIFARKDTVESDSTDECGRIHTSAAPGLFCLLM